MNTTQAREISIEKVLQNLGCQMTKNNETETWYLSPFRVEKTASFKINKKINRWFDHGEQVGGNVIDFVMLKFGFSVPEALNYLNQFTDFFSFQEQVFYTEENENKIEIVSEIKHAALIQYLDGRGISIYKNIDILKEVHYSLKGKMFFGLGFMNKSNGFEIRSKYSKICLGKKDITHINNQNDKIRIFEGFFDYLTFKEIQFQKDFKDSDYLILNSVALINKNLPIIEKYTQIEIFLDNDETGNKYTQLIQNKFLYAIDKRDFYKGYKDLNEWYLNELKS